MIDPRLEEQAALAALGWSDDPAALRPCRGAGSRAAAQAMRDSPTRRPSWPAMRRSRAAARAARAHLGRAGASRAASRARSRGAARKRALPLSAHRADAVRAGRVPDGPRAVQAGLILVLDKRLDAARDSPRRITIRSPACNWSTSRRRAITAMPRSWWRGTRRPAAACSRWTDMPRPPAGPRLPALGARSLEARAGQRGRDPARRPLAAFRRRAT